MTTPSKKLDTKVLGLHISAAEYDHIEGIARHQSRNKLDIFRLAMSEYCDRHGYGPLPVPQRPRRGRPPRS